MRTKNVLVLLAAAVAASASAQENPEKPAKAGKPARPARNAERSADTVKHVPTKALGASIETRQFIDAAASPEGRRLAFDPIPAGIAFEVWMEGMKPRMVSVAEPAAEKPGETPPVAKPFVSVLRVADAEWDEFVAFMMEGVEGGDVASFKSAVLYTMLDQKGMLLHYRDDLPSVAQRALPALEKLAQGTPFKQVARVYSEDPDSGRADGLLDEDTRGGMLPRYPFGKVAFELQPGEITGPIFSKDAAYLVRVEYFTRSSTPRFDRARLSGLVIKYTTGQPLSGRMMSEIRESLRIRTEQERFKLIVPPGIQIPAPKTFGPDDIAPIGTPNAPLKRLGDERP